MTIEHPTPPLRRGHHGEPLGEWHHRAVLTDYQVHEIRDARENRREGVRAIAERLGLKYNTVRAIVYYRRRISDLTLQEP